jgi:hypothetical protein
MIAVDGYLCHLLQSKQAWCGVLGVNNLIKVTYYTITTVGSLHHGVTCPIVRFQHSKAHVIYD